MWLGGQVWSIPASSLWLSRETRTLRTLLPELAGEHSVPMEVVAGAAARTLSLRGGIAGWLRTARRKSPNKANIPLIFNAS